jgi:Crinkler effector protein N-terminal domain
MSDQIRSFCWVQGDEHNQIFDIEIERSALITELKETIKPKKPSFEKIAADSLKLYKVGEWYRYVFAQIFTHSSSNCPS